MLQYKLVARINNKEFKVEDKISLFSPRVSLTLIKTSGGRGHKSIDKREGNGLGGEGESFNHSTFQNPESQNQRSSCQCNLVSRPLCMLLPKRVIKLALEDSQIVVTLRKCSKFLIYIYDVVELTFYQSPTNIMLLLRVIFTTWLRKIKLDMKVWSSPVKILESVQVQSLHPSVD